MSEEIYPTDEEVFWEAYARAIARKSEELLASPTFRKHATQNELKEIVLLKSEIAWGPLPPVRLPRVNIGYAPAAAPARAAAALAAAVVAAAGIGGKSTPRGSSTASRPGPAVPAVPVAVLSRAQAVKRTADLLLAKVVLIAERVGATQRAAVVKAMQDQVMTQAITLIVPSLTRLAPQAALLKRAATMTAAILASKLDEVKDAFLATVREVMDLIRKTPPPPGGCDDVVQAFKDASLALKDALNNWKKSDQLSQARYANANKSWQKAVNAVLDCLGIERLF
ncbi:MAG TPA: hypothetical protein VM597_26435 [Gemmataceae bacterium]|jgi:hypothetical protein|nr:hypothetical protein [Gemmataceae bacterium]